MKDAQMLEWKEKLEKSRFAKQVKIIISKERRKEVVKITREALETIARFMIRNETRENIYWNREEERLFKLCKKEEEDIEHVLEKCEKTGDNKENLIN